MDELSWSFLAKFLIVFSCIIFGILFLVWGLKKVGYGKLVGQGGGLKIKSQWHLNAKNKVAIICWPYADLLVSISPDGVQLLDKHSHKKDSGSKDSKNLTISEFKSQKTPGKH